MTRTQYTCFSKKSDYATFTTVQGREVPRNAPRSEADFWFETRTATDRVIVPGNNARNNGLRGVPDPTFANVRRAIESRAQPRGVADSVPILE